MTQRCKHVDAIKAELEAAGATGITVSREGGSVRIGWSLHGRSGHLTTSSAPRDAINAGNMGRQAVRRACREVRVS